MSKYYLFKEFNDWEGEQWLFYINADMNKNNTELFKQLESRLNEMDVNKLESSFDQRPMEFNLSNLYTVDEFEKPEYIEDEEDESGEGLIKKNSYMDEINIIDDEFDHEKLTALLLKTDDELFDSLYKGKIEEFIKVNK